MIRGLSTWFVTKDREQALSKAEAAYRRSSGRLGDLALGGDDVGNSCTKLRDNGGFNGKTIGKP